MPKPPPAPAVLALRAPVIRVALALMPLEKWTKTDAGKDTVFDLRFHRP